MREIPCGLYRATLPIDDRVPAGALVYYHNHGEPGPGVYLPRTWSQNRAVFHEQGVVIPDPSYAESLQPLLAEGLYRVAERFPCCAKGCVTYEEDQLVQLGYNARAEPILFIPELLDGTLHFPSQGAVLDETRLARLRPLKVSVGKAPAPPALHLN